MGRDEIKSTAPFGSLQEIVGALVLYFIVMVIFGLLIVGYAFYKGFWQEGMMDFFNYTMMRLMFVPMWLFGMRFVVRHFLISGDWGGDGKRAFLVFPVSVLTIVLAIGIMVNPLLDLLAIDHPESVTMHNVRLYMGNIDDEYSYHLSGVDENDGFYDFRLTSSSYNEGQEMTPENGKLDATVEYLPHSKAVVRVTFSSGNTANKK